MNIRRDYFFLSIEGRKKFEEWRDEVGLTESAHFKILECLYKKGPQMIAQIAVETKLIPNDIMLEVEAFVQDGYIQSYTP